MTFADLRLPCKHGRYEAHGMVGFEDDAVVVYDRSDCQGGRSATIEDLGGKQVAWCVEHESPAFGAGTWCQEQATSPSVRLPCAFVDAFVFIPSGVTAEEET